MSEAKIEDPYAYKTFNDFFTRELKLSARAIDESESAIISPADGAVSERGKIEKIAIFQAKNKNFSLNALLANSNYTTHFIDGNFATIYLSPKDYHRIHMPFTGRLLEMRYVPGKLFSVNSVTTNHIDGLFAKNERMIAIFETEIGKMAVIMVGAMIVAGIHTVWHGQMKRELSTTDYHDQEIVLKKGELFGHFELGSTVILLFEKNKIKLDEKTFSGKAVKVGEKIASCYE